MIKKPKMVVKILFLVLSFCQVQAASADSEQLSAAAAYEIGLEAYTYFYPIVTMDVTRKVMTNVPPNTVSGMGPENMFHHMRAYPTADVKTVVRPNFDTLYSSAWLDLSKEPIIVSVPDTDGRYYLLPMLDMWSDVFAVPGKRTSGTKAGNYAIVPAGWHGTLPKGIIRIDSPTKHVWIIGRTQTNGVKDYDAVHKVQDGYKLSPLSQFGKTLKPGPFKGDPSVDMKTPPLAQVNAMKGTDFLAYGAKLLGEHQAHITDWSTLARLKRIGIEPGKKFDASTLNPEIKDALNKAAVDGLKNMQEKISTVAHVANGWEMNTDTMGVYGNYYLKRAIVAMLGLGANQPEDAIYPMLLTDSDGDKITADKDYVIHFSKSEIPPVNAFWSVTMYDEEGFQVPNPINRFAIGDRDNLKFNSDGSLDIYIQHESPGADKESNWLPSPAKGELGITMRLYSPKLEALIGKWVPPAVKD